MSSLPSFLEVRACLCVSVPGSWCLGGAQGPKCLPSNSDVNPKPVCITFAFFEIGHLPYLVLFFLFFFLSLQGEGEAASISHLKFVFLPHNFYLVLLSHRCLCHPPPPLPPTGSTSNSPLESCSLPPTCLV